jgi:hypothetical protein
VGLRADLDTEARGKILCPCRGSKPSRPVCSQYDMISKLNFRILILTLLAKFKKVNDLGTQSVNIAGLLPSHSQECYLHVSYN